MGLPAGTTNLGAIARDKNSGSEASLDQRQPVRTDARILTLQGFEF